MACRIQNITDPKLQQLIDENGPKDGLDKYLKEYHDLIKDFEPKDKISSDKLIELKHQLDIKNSEDKTDHELYINDGKDEFRYGVKELDPNKEYQVKFNANWGSSINSPETKLVDTKLYSNGVEGTAFNEGDIDPNEANKYLQTEGFVPTDYNDAGFASLADEINGRNLSDYDVIIEDPSLYTTTPDQVYKNIMNQANGNKGEVGSGIGEVLKRIYSNVIDINKGINNLKKNRDSINSEIKSLRKSGVLDNDPQIQDKINRVKSLNAKIVERNNTFIGLKRDLSKVKSAKTIGNLQNLFDDHLKFALKVANIDHADAGDMLRAAEAMETWGNIRELSLSTLDKINPDVYEALGQIESKAKSFAINELRLKTLEYAEDESIAMNLSMRKEDFTHSVDVGLVARGVMSLAGAKSKVLPLFHGIFKRMNIKSSIEFDEKSRVLGQLESDMKSRGFKWTDFLDDNLHAISRISSKFYEERAKQMDKYNETANINKNNDTEGYDPKHLGRAIREKNAWLKNNTYIINPEEISTPEGRKRVKDKITQMSGDSKYAEDRIVDAQMKYENFQRDKASYIDFLNNEFTSPNPSIKIADKDELNRKINNFSKYNSPVEYKKYIDKSFAINDLRPDNKFEDYSTEIPLDHHNITDMSTGFYNDDFKNKIINNPDAYDILNRYGEYMHEMLSYLPNYMTDKLGEFFFPNQREDFWGRVRRNGFKEFWNFDKSKLIETIATRPGQNDQYGSLSSGNKVRDLSQLDI